MVSKSTRRWRTFFLLAAAYNAAVAIPFLLAEGAIREHLGLPPAELPILSQMLFSFVLVFGWGYYRVARDLEKNHDVVRLGGIAKGIAGLLCVGHALLGKIPWALAAPGIGDLVFLGFFVKFLRERGD